jgi:hypothetical protein
MGHRINEWIQRLLIPVCVIAAILLLRLGFSAWRTLAIVMPLFGVLILVMVVLDPGPKMRGFVAGLKSRLH